MIADAQAPPTAAGFQAITAQAPPLTAASSASPPPAATPDGSAATSSAGTQATNATNKRSRQWEVDPTSAFEGNLTPESTPMPKHSK